MLDLAFVRSNLDRVVERLATRGGALPLDRFRELDQKRRAAITEAEQLKAQKNAESVRVGELKRSGTDTTEIQAAIRLMGDRITALDKEKDAVNEEFQELLRGIPNIPHESVPVGDPKRITSPSAATGTRRNSTSNRRRIGTLARHSAFWISIAP